MSRRSENRRAEVRPAGPLLRRLLRAPTLLYRLGMGPLLGHRFLLLRHRGRHSGRAHLTMLEVLSWDPTQKEAVVMSGWGARSDWYLNVLAGGAEEVQIGRRRFHPVTRALQADDAAETIERYEEQHRLAAPLFRRGLSRLAKFRYDGSPEMRLRLVAALPLVAFSSADVEDGPVDATPK
ncbi:MAG: nitroreductase family deazaflavin-dependent oxidoreductase [Solirubrobacterales bacterium]